jgi:hypothetical protein
VAVAEREKFERGPFRSLAQGVSGSWCLRFAGAGRDKCLGVIRHYDFVTYETKDKKTNEVTCQSTTWAIDVQHDSFIARYSEIAPDLPNGLKAGSEVSEGQVIATVGTQCGGSMLHFEMFKDRTRVAEYLTNKSHSTGYTNVAQANNERRDDLMDPTPFLDMWSHDLLAKLHLVDLGDLNF